MSVVSLVSGYGRLWDQKPVISPNGVITRIKSSHPFIQIVFNNGGDKAAALNTQNQIYVLHFSSNRYSMLGYAGQVKYIKFIRNDIVVALHDGGIKKFAAEAFEELQTVRKFHNGAVTHIISSTNQNSECVATASQESICVWNDWNWIKSLKLPSNNKVIQIGFTTHGLVALFPEILVIWNDSWEIVSKINLTKSYDNMLVQSHFLVLCHQTGLDYYALSDLEPRYISSLAISGCQQIFADENTDFRVYVRANNTLLHVDLDTNSMRVFSEKLHWVDISNDHATSIFDGTIVVYHLPSAFLSGFFQIKSSSKVSTSVVSETDVLQNYDYPRKNNFAGSDKYIALLYKYHEYPEKYRVKIWSLLLKIPLSREYLALVSKGVHPRYNHLSHRFPVVSGVLARRLNTCLSCLGWWCEYSTEIDYLPLIVFPFVSVIRSDLHCFEVCASLINNIIYPWLSSWPNPPMTLLLACESMIRRKASSLYSHLTQLGANCTHYIWPLLRSMFSSVLSGVEWRSVMDHLISSLNQGTSLIYFLAAQYILHIGGLLRRASSLNEICSIMERQNGIDIKSWIRESKKDMTTHDFVKLDLPKFQYLSSPYPVVVVTSGTYIADFMLKEHARIQKELKIEEEKENTHRLNLHLLNEVSNNEYESRILAEASMKTNENLANRMDEEATVRQNKLNILHKQHIARSAKQIAQLELSLRNAMEFREKQRLSEEKARKNELKLQVFEESEEIKRKKDLNLLAIAEKNVYNGALTSKLIREEEQKIRLNFAQEQYEKLANSYESLEMDRKIALEKIFSDWKFQLAEQKILHESDLTAKSLRNELEDFLKRKFEEESHIERKKFELLRMELLDKMKSEEKIMLQRHESIVNKLNEERSAKLALLQSSESRPVNSMHNLSSDFSRLQKHMDYSCAVQNTLQKEQESQSILNQHLENSIDKMEKSFIDLPESISMIPNKTECDESPNDINSYPSDKSQEMKQNSLVDRDVLHDHLIRNDAILSEAQNLIEKHFQIQEVAYGWKINDSRNENFGIPLVSSSSCVDAFSVPVVTYE